MYQKVSIDSRCRSPHSTLSWFLRMMEWGKSVVKNTKKRVSNNWPKLSSTNRVFGEREREKTFRAAKEDDGLKLLRNQKESVRHIFDSYCKKILRQENAGMKRSEVRRRAREYSLSELPPELLEKLRYNDAFDFNYSALADFPNCAIPKCTCYEYGSNKYRGKCSVRSRYAPAHYSNYVENISDFYILLRRYIGIVFILLFQRHNHSDFIALKIRKSNVEIGARRKSDCIVKG